MPQNIKPNPHGQKTPLQAPRDDINPPGAPPASAQARRQTGRPDKTAGRLDAHHGDAQAGHAAKPPGGVDLWEVLQQCEQRADDTEQVGPRLQVHGRREREVQRQHGRDERVHETDYGDGQGGAEAWVLFFMLVVIMLVVVVMVMVLGLVVVVCVSVSVGV